MATFTQDVLRSVDIADPKEGKRYLDELEQASIAAQKQHGMGEVVGLNRFQQQDSSNQWLGQEQTRRADAAKQAFSLAGTADERIAGARNALQDVYDKYNQSAAALAQKEGQSSIATDWEVAAAAQTQEQKLGETTFAAYKSSAERKDAMASALRDGTANESILEAASANQLKIQDAENYWTTEMNTINEDLKDYSAASDIEFLKWATKLQQDAASWGGIVEGVFTIGGAILGGATGAAIGKRIGGAVAGATA